MIENVKKLVDWWISELEYQCGGGELGLDPDGGELYDGLVASAEANEDEEFLEELRGVDREEFNTEWKIRCDALVASGDAFYTTDDF